MIVSAGEEKPIRKTKEKPARPIRKTVRQAILGKSLRTRDQTSDFRLDGGLGSLLVLGGGQLDR
jgi:hypothetical protein